MADFPFFEQNRAALAKNSPQEAEKIAGYIPQIQNRLYPTVPAKQPYLNVSYPVGGSGGVSLFETVDPHEEIQDWVHQHKLNRQTVHAVILIGFGLGYAAKEILRYLPAHGVFAIIEPDPIVFFTAFCYADLQVVLSDRRVHLVIGQPAEKSTESIGRELKWQRFLSLPYLLVSAPYMRRRDADYTRQFTKHWRDCLQRELMYRNSRIENSSQVVANTVANSQAVITYPGVSSLFYHFRNQPAVLVAAGPSLNEHIESLREYQERFLLCCVNSAYPVLRKHGIEPHIVITMDHQDRNLLSFQEYPPTANTFLIADPRISPEIIKRFHPRVFLASWKTTLEGTGEPQPIDRIPVPEKSGNAYYEWLQQYAGVKGDVFGSGSVAVAAFHILCRMGVRQVVLVGQDLAFAGQKAYAQGTIFEDQRLPRDDRLTQQVLSTDGEMVGTSETLYLYKHLLEHEIARFGIPVLNTSSGAVIQGTITTRFASLGAEWTKPVPHVPEVLTSLLQSYRPKMDHIDLQRRLEQAVMQLRGLSEDARSFLNELPMDWRETLLHQQPKEWLQRIETKIQSVQENHAEAYSMMNELLQESHFKFEDGTWQALMMEREEDILQCKLESHVMVLDEFVKQSNALIGLLEEHISVLDNL